MRSANRKGFPRVDHVNNVRHLQNLVHQTRSHCRGSAKRLVDAAEIVEHEIERQGVAVVLEFLGERIGQPGKAAHLRYYGANATGRLP